MKSLADQKREAIAAVELDVDLAIQHVIHLLATEEIVEWLGERVRWNDDAYQDFLSKPAQ